MTPTLTRPAPDELHLWTVPWDPKEGRIQELCEKVLAEREMERFKKLKFKEQRLERTISQAALRSLLSGYLGESPASIQLGRSSKGKPWCQADPSLRFNISNSDGMAVLGFAHEQEIGVDIEKVRPMKDLDELIRSNFKPSEVRQIERKPEERKERFFRFWTFKESYLKAIGEGMRLPPEKLEFSLENGKVRLVSSADPDGDADWYFQEFIPAEGYRGTITHRKEGTRILERSIDPEQFEAWINSATNGSEAKL